MDSTADTDCPGPWLRSWIEFQVDARINQAFREMVSTDLEKNGAWPTEELGNPAGEVTTPRPGQAGQWRSVAENQAKLLRVIEGLSNEIVQLSAVSERQQAELDCLCKAVKRSDSRLSLWRSEVAFFLRKDRPAVASVGDQDHTTLERIGEVERGLVLAQQDLLDRVEAVSAAVTADMRCVEAQLASQFRDELRIQFQDEGEAQVSLRKQLAVVSERLDELQSRCSSAPTSPAPAFGRPAVTNRGLLDLSRHGSIGDEYPPISARRDVRVVETVQSPYSFMVER